MKKRYKLIKEYPNSPKLGTIITEGNHYGYIGFLINSMPFNPTKYPEFWEEVVEKDYEILSFRQKYSGWLWTKFTNGWCRNSNGKPVTYPYSYDDILNNHLNGGIEYHIHSVKRLSDGEVFTVGNNTNFGIIKSIHRLICDYKDDRGVLDTITFGVSEDDEDVYLKEIQHKKIPLFTTEDGVDIYGGDKVCAVYIPQMSLFDPEVKLYNSALMHTNLKYFSTKEAAEEYILMNKPCLSVNYILKRFNSRWSEVNEVTLKELVKQKLDKK